MAEFRSHLHQVKAHRVAQLTEAGGGLMVAVIQLSIALGSTVGGMLFDSHGYQSTFVASAIVLLLGAAVTVLTSHAPPSRTA